MIGGAYGDSLGAPVEFSTSDEIKNNYGQAGITNLEPIYGQAGNITDDTQMAIATAEGLIDTPASQIRDPQIIRQHLWLAYQRWHESQSDSSNWRQPGNTCLSALEGQVPGEIGPSPINNSAGCGGIMRAHPVGLVFSDRHRAYQIGAVSAALTHGNPYAYVPAGFLSSLISQLADGDNFDQALDSTSQRIESKPNNTGTLLAIGRALAANTKTDSFEEIDNLVGGGGGWLGHDALAIAIFSVRRALTNPLESVRVAVNHNGDSDSTGSIAGAIVGTIHGPEPFFEALKEQKAQLEHSQLLGRLAINLAKIRN